VAWGCRRVAVLAMLGGADGFGQRNAELGRGRRGEERNGGRPCRLRTDGEGNRRLAPRGRSGRHGGHVEEDTRQVGPMR
jgi:hypothetical protein